jgi:hypothetical protein
LAHFSDDETVVKMGHASKTAFPKWESLKNKSRKSGMFFAPEKQPSTHQRFTSNPPQIHQRKTTFCTPFLPKPPAKTG